MLCLFYPRSPCGERRINSSAPDIATSFLSTLSLRRATIHGRKRIRTPKFFYPRSPCGERHLPLRKFLNMLSFLSTLSLRRATFGKLKLNIGSLNFLSTLSLRRATQVARIGVNKRRISIHALLAESDSHIMASPAQIKAFLSTLSLRRATRREF